MNHSVPEPSGRLARLWRLFAELAEAMEMTEAEMMCRRLAALENEVRLLRASRDRSDPTSNGGAGAGASL